MSRTISLRLCLVVLLCLSGCNALSGGEAAETPMVTPADVPTDAPTSTYGLAPGLTRQGVVEPVTLGRAHEAVLEETSYTNLWTKTVRYTNGSLRVRGTSTRHVVVPTEQYYVSVEWHWPSSNRFNYTFVSREFWSDGERVLASISRGNNTTYRHHESPNSPIFTSDLPRGERFHNLFYAINTNVVNQTMRNGTTLYRLTGTEITDLDALFRINSRYKHPRNLSFHATIDSRGLVHKYRLAYTATLTTTSRPTPVRIVKTTRYTKIGNTTVERPPWYSKANQTTPVRTQRE
jgi:hypothetical protein